MRQCCCYGHHVGTHRVPPSVASYRRPRPCCRKSGIDRATCVVFRGLQLATAGHRFVMAESSRSRVAPQSTMGGRGGGGSLSPAPGGKGGGSPPPLAATYPVNTLMELKLKPFGDTIRGLVYCTDEFSNSIVLKKALTHTTLSSEVTIVNASSVLERKAIEYAKGEGGGTMTEDDARKLAGVDDLDELKLPLPNVAKKVLEERERRAIRLAEESFSHINQRVSLLVSVH